jgi:DNA-binding response OmpR family regulator
VPRVTADNHETMARVTPYSHVHALVVDDMPAQQTTLRAQLAMLGISRVDGATSPEQALRLIRRHAYGLVLCDYNLGHRTDGQQLLEHLRSTQTLAADCLFFMITAENGYAAVASASEQLPDAYLVKPATASDIEERLKSALERRHALLPITQRLQAEDLPGALQACDEILARRDRWSLASLQLKAQALLAAARPDEAIAVYRQVLAARPGLVWAAIGVARAHKAAGRLPDAEASARAVIDRPDGRSALAAYDVLADALDAQGRATESTEVLRQAAAIVPSARRMRRLGESAFRTGDLVTACECLAKAAQATRGSLTADPQDTLTLAQALVDAGEPGSALAALAEAEASMRDDTAATGAAWALRAQALAATGERDAACHAAEQARQRLGAGAAGFAAVALARAELASGQESQGLERLKRCVCADHENPQLRQWAQAALQRSGRAQLVDTIVEAASREMRAGIRGARTQLRDGDTLAALAAIEATLATYPDNTGVLLEATQMNCLALRLGRSLDGELLERAQRHLARLEQLMPDADRVANIRRYLRETVALLASQRPDPALRMPERPTTSAALAGAGS